MIKIRKSDWRDRQAIQSLRRLMFPIDGGLYELLHWPIYHVHHVMSDGQVVGFTSVCLDGQGSADDVGTIVTSDPSLYPVLRRVQVRDLAVMGYHHLTAAVTEEQRPWTEPFFGPPIGQVGPAQWFYSESVDVIQRRMQSAGVTDPLPLSNDHIEALQHKAAQVHAFIRHLNQLSMATKIKADLLKGR